MIVYKYDGSFDGLLTCIYEAFYKSEKPEAIVADDEAMYSFLDTIVLISTDLEKSKRVYNAINEKVSYKSLKKVFYAYLSDLPNSGILVYRYLQIAFKMGKEVDQNLTNEHVFEMDRVYKKVAKEVHRLTGLLRFKKIDGDILYAQVEPDHNVVALLAPHFCARISNENFIIHDTKRALAVFYNKSEWELKSVDTVDGLSIKDKDEIYEELWRVYFDSIAIKNKINPKLQKRNMPMRYWKHLTEKN